MDHSSETIIPSNARSVSHKSLPPCPPQHLHGDNNTCQGSILLFYQYIEPQWTKKQHKSALKKVIEIGQRYNITGRGRVAAEGLNCTLTSSNPTDIRSFCYALRDWDDVFHDTDFKITDGIGRDKLFKSLSIRKTEELVAYGLASDKAPSLKKFAGEHLEADEYHKAMEDPETVIIDVRNAYESAIGNFQPPKNGAKLIDPKMRNSIEFPKWLNSEQTQKQLTGKKVLMYCTGGIRCERATALLNQMSTVKEELKPKGVYHCRGGIERYVKTFPSGGYWKGKNYLFDKRMEQTPDIKDDGAVEKDIASARCCLCQVKHTIYRGQFKCSRGRCGVPVIVCNACTTTATEKPGKLVCELCKEGYRAPSEAPDLVALKRKAEELVGGDPPTHAETTDTSVERHPLAKKPKVYYNDRVFLRRVPLTASFTKIKELLGDDMVKRLVWMIDKESGGFYGSCVVLLSSLTDLKKILDRSTSSGIKMDKKRIKVAEVFRKGADDDEGLLFHNFVQREYPPVGS